MTHLAQLPQRTLVHQLVLPGKVPAPLLVGLDGGVGFPLVHSHRGQHRGSRVGQGSGCTLLRSRVHRGSLPGQDEGRMREASAFKLSPQQRQGLAQAVAMSGPHVPQAEAPRSLPACQRPEPCRERSRRPGFAGGREALEPTGQ